MEERRWKKKEDGRRKKKKKEERRRRRKKNFKFKFIVLLIIKIRKWCVCNLHAMFFSIFWVPIYNFVR